MNESDIRKDEREKCARIADAIAEECHDCMGSLFSYAADARCEDVAAVIRGEKQLADVLKR